MLLQINAFYNGLWVWTACLVIHCTAGNATILVKQIGITLLCVVGTIYYSHTTLKQLAFIYFMRLKKHLKTYDFHCQVSKKAYHRHLVCIQK